MGIGVGGDVNSSGELHVLDKLSQNTQNASTVTVIDVGANVGDWTTSVLQKVPQAYVHCFEPHPVTFQTLQKNLGSRPRITFVNEGLGSETGTLTLYSNPEYDGLSSLYDRELNHFGLSLDHQHEVKVNTLDLYCDSHNLTKIDLLKMDVEGHELQVLHGALEIIKFCDMVQFEFGGCNIDSRTFFQDFWKYFHAQNMDIVRITPNGFLPIDKYEEVLEQFTTTNYLAFRKK